MFWFGKTKKTYKERDFGKEWDLNPCLLSTKEFFPVGEAGKELPGLGCQPQGSCSRPLNYPYN